MIGVIRHQDMSPNGNHMIKFYGSLLDFAIQEANLKVHSNGTVEAFGRPLPHSYIMEQWTEEEIIRDVARTTKFKEVAKANFYTFYKMEKL
jgi:hypothetical protein